MQNKTLGPVMNARPAKSINQRPAAPGYQTRPTASVAGANRFANPAPQRTMPSSHTEAKTVSTQPARPTTAPAAHAMPNTAPRAVQADAISGYTRDFMESMRHMIGGFTILNEDVIEKNLRLMAGDGMSNEDRTMTFDCADYIMSHLAYMFMGIVLDAKVKKAFIDAVSIEITMDTLPEEERIKRRKEMKDESTDTSANGTIVFGLTTFTPNAVDYLMDKAHNSFNELDAYADEFDSASAQLTDSQKAENGYIFSNFMYLIRAFSHNDIFFGWVVTIIEGVKKKLAQG